MPTASLLGSCTHVIGPDAAEVGVAGGGHPERAERDGLVDPRRLLQAGPQRVQLRLEVGQVPLQLVAPLATAGVEVVQVPAPAEPQTVHRRPREVHVHTAHRCGRGGRGRR